MTARTRRVRRIALAVSGALAMSLSVTAVGSAGAAAETFTGTCTDTVELPCSASAGQAYDGYVIDASGNDFEAAVEAVLSEAVGPYADVSALERGLTRSSGDFQFTPNDVTRGQRFDWTYTGDAANHAYVTVKAANGFAVFGIAGQTSGTIDVAGLLGGHEISHLSVWSTNVSQTTPIKATKLHGKPKSFLGNMRLGKITKGTVPCLHVETAESATCKFGRKSGKWLESTKGPFAVTGQAVTLDGKPGGEYVTATKISPDGTVPGLEPTGNDTAGTPGESETLDGAAIIEDMGAAYNASGRDLVNYATLEVCTSSYPHPDGTPLRSYYWTGSTYVFCYVGTGAGLNDPNGTERDAYGNYYRGSEYSHVTMSPDYYETPAAKRPATIPYPYPGTINRESPLVWRPVSTVTIAND
ncbi:MAG: hypothetical protein GEU97_17850 [Actinophytocola sp.]|nr:hypothetical protein [Actinophytocola sp.]